MKRVGYTTNQSGERVTLVEAMADYANVQKAYNKARKCKRYRKDVLIFTKDKEGNLEEVRDDILNLSYEPSEYHYFKVFEPKERQIMALPFYDRVVQHAINNVLEPIFDKRFISQSYACRKGKGMHAASDTLQEWLYEWQKFHPDEPLYAIKADIHHYFQSIDHGIRLALNPKTTILAAKNGVDFVGYKHRATHRKVRPDSIKRVKRTIKKCESGKITKEQLQKSIQSWTGHAGHADSYNLRKKIKSLADAAIQKAA